MYRTKQNQSRRTPLQALTSSTGIKSDGRTPAGKRVDLLRLGLLLVLAVASSSVSAIGGVLHVDALAVGSNDGSSWTDAFTDLQPALAAAVSGDEIWVAAGSYKPASPLDTGRGAPNA